MSEALPHLLARSLACPPVSGCFAPSGLFFHRRWRAPRCRGSVCGATMSGRAAPAGALPAPTSGLCRSRPFGWCAAPGPGSRPAHCSKGSAFDCHAVCLLQRPGTCICAGERPGRGPGTGGASGRDPGSPGWHVPGGSSLRSMAHARQFMRLHRQSRCRGASCPWHFPIAGGTSPTGTASTGGALDRRLEADSAPGGGSRPWLDIAASADAKPIFGPHRRGGTTRVARVRGHLHTDGSRGMVCRAGSWRPGFRDWLCMRM